MQNRKNILFNLTKSLKMKGGKILYLKYSPKNLIFVNFLRKRGFIYNFEVFSIKSSLILKILLTSSTKPQNFLKGYDRTVR